jgi:hypothetical protein
MIEVGEIRTTDLSIRLVGSYRLAYRDEIDQRNERGINPFKEESGRQWKRGEYFKKDNAGPS